MKNTKIFKFYTIPIIFLVFFTVKKAEALCLNDPDECGTPDTTGCECDEYCYQHCCVPDPTPSCSTPPSGPGEPWTPPSTCSGCSVDNYTCRDSCLECPKEEHAGWCTNGQHYCRTKSCGCCSSTPPPNTKSPKGWLDSAACNADGKITVSGWTCDADDYSVALDVHVYMDGKAGSGGTLISSGTANIPAEEAVGGQCGGKRDHRFYITTPDSVPGGTYEIYAYGINIGSAGSNELLSGSPKTVKCSCTPQDGTWGAWSDCIDGQQTRTCNGTTCCGTNCGTCPNDGYGTTRACARMEGIIWSGAGDDWPLTAGSSFKGLSSLTCTNNYNPNFHVTNSKTTGDQIKSWWCHSTNNTAYYGGDHNIPVEGTMTATLTGLPTNYICDRWVYRTKSKNNQVSGTFGNNITTCTTGNITLAPEDWRNVNWKLINCSDTHWEDIQGSCSTLCGPGTVNRVCKFPDSRCPGTPVCDPNNPPPTPCNNTPADICHYTVETTVKEIEQSVVITDPGNQCSAPMSNASKLPGATVTINNNTGQPPFNGSAISDSNGIASINVPYGIRSIIVNSYLTTEGDTPDTYSMVCPSFGNYVYPTPPTLIPYIASGTIPANGAYPSIPVQVGLRRNYKFSWLSVIDADMFSKGLDIAVPLGPTNNANTSQTPQGFAKVLLNTIHPNPSLNDDLMLGYSFVENSNVSNPNIDAPIPNTKLSEVSPSSSDQYQYGGIAYNLEASGQSHKSKWLENFTFNPPSNATEISSLPTTFSSGSIYKIEENVETNASGYTYTINGNNGPVIIYIDGDLVIRGNISTTSSQRILFVVSGSVIINSDVGTPADSFNMSHDPNVMAGIIANGSITVNKRNDRDVFGGKYDIPIMLSAPLVSKTNISLQRDLGHDKNAIIPGQSVKQYNKLLFDISNLERDKNSDDLHFTGITTFDLDWEYIY